MGSITDTFAEAFRNYATSGVPASGAHEPDKGEIRSIGPLIEAAIGGVGLGALLSVIKATKDDLDADREYAAGSVGLVYADPTDAYNDLYTKSGGVGSGSWTLTTVLHDIIEGLAQPYVDQAQAASADFQTRRAGLVASAARIAYNFVSNAARNSDESVTFSAGGDVRWYAYDVSAALYPDGITITVPKLSGGSFSTMTVTEQDSAETTTVSAANMTETADRVALTIGSLHASTARLRISLNSEAAVVLPPMVHEPDQEPVFWGNQTPDSALAMVENYIRAIDEKPNVRDAYGLLTSVDTGGDLTLSDFLVTVPDGSRGSFKISMVGRAVAADSAKIVLKASSRLISTTATGNGISCFPHTGVSGGVGATSIARALGHGLYLLDLLTVEAASGADPAYIEVTLDNRGGSSDQTVELLYVGINASVLPSFLDIPLVVSRALLENGAQPVFVDAIAGSDTDGNGSISEPFATAERAAGSGATSLALRAAQSHRVTAPIAFSSVGRVRLFSWRESGDSDQCASLRASVALTSADMTATSADAHVYFSAAIPDDPEGIWEDTGALGMLARFGELGNPSGDTVREPHARTSVNEAAVRAAAGRWWWGAGSEGTGLYLRPSGDSWTGKSYEVPVADHAISVTDAGLLEWDDVEVGFGRVNAALVGAVTCRTRSCRIGYSGSSDGLSIGEGVDWLGISNQYLQAGDDGINTKGSCRLHEIDVWARYNVGDGIAPHLDNNDVTIDGGLLEENGKQGFVTIGDGIERTVLRDVKGRNNYSTDFLIQLDAAATLSTVEVIGCTGVLKINHETTPANITAMIERHRGSITLECNATVSGLFGPCRVDGGTVTLDDFKAVNQAAHGLRITAGTLNATDGHILRNGTGILQSGGTLNLDAAKPVNVYGNTTNFSGVSGGEQAKALSFAAV